ncbi:DNA translocase FtsK [Veillonella sp. CHU732]|uniref:DNA translocase FtsK n=1 Tax=Veillonella sp. CHU732 TaxID=2490949 RepID=UPI000F8C8D98|nr:DNA translocase FtsK [Veillonella sp. CHU732]
MAEEKKGRSSRGGQKVQSKRSTPLKESKTGATKQAKAQTKGVRSEIKGLVLMGFAILALIGMAGVETGIWGSIISGIFSYGFGLGGWVVALWVLYNGWCWLYKGSLAAITRKGLLYTGVLLVVLVQLVLWKVNNGDELSTTTLTENGGVVGGLLGSLFRNLVGDVGGILLSAIIGIACVLGITKLSLREGLHKAKDKASVGLEIAQEKATETASAIREQVHEWQEEWREERRKAYDREKDTRYPKTEASSDEIEVEPNTVAEIQGKMDYTTTVEVSEPSVVDVESMEPSDSMIDTAELEAMEPSKDVTIMQPPMEDYEDEEAYIPEPHIREDEVVTSASEVESVEAPPMVDSAEAATEDTSGEIYTTDVDEEPHVTEVFTELEPITPPSFLQTTNYVGSLVEVPTIETTKEDTAAVAVNTDGVARPRTIEKPYQYPPLTMLSQGKSNPVTSEEVAHNAVLLEETLDNFGITAKVVNATQGPTVTRYELEPAKGTKVSRIMGLQDDLKMSLAAVDIRMEAPIPGKSAVGIEIPNKNVSSVHLRDVLDCEEFQQASGGIPVGLGKDIADMPVITDLAKMPHLLVAGSTGSGKSVCVNTLISSILFSRKPDEVKLILVDPKMVELSVYNGIPHLMLPVVTDMNKAAAVLRWAVREMDARYMTLATAGVRNVASYNKQNPTKSMPLILIIIDELADLMMTNPDVEESIDRLAAKARAAGIHMVLATQRPSVDVITGKIKANVPSRIAFTVATQIDSRTILDQAGAERLLGRGDMLFNPIGANKPIRIQGAFISDEEVEELIAFVKGQGQPEYDEVMMAETDKGAESSDAVSSDEEQDELLERAVQIVLEQRSASASILQRRLRVGFSRAGRLIDTMQDMKIIGPPTNSSKGRDILMGEDQIRELYFPNFTVD